MAVLLTLRAMCVLVTEEQSFLEGAIAQWHYGDIACPRVLWLQAEDRSQTETALHPLLDIKTIRAAKAFHNFCLFPKFHPLGPVVV